MWTFFPSKPPSTPKWPSQNSESEASSLAASQQQNGISSRVALHVFFSDRWTMMRMTKQGDQDDLKLHVACAISKRRELVVLTNSTATSQDGEPTCAGTPYTRADHFVFHVTFSASPRARSWKLHRRRRATARTLPSGRARVLLLPLHRAPLAGRRVGAIRARWTVRRRWQDERSQTRCLHAFAVKVCAAVMCSKLLHHGVLLVLYKLNLAKHRYRGWHGEGRGLVRRLLLAL